MSNSDAPLERALDMGICSDSVNGRRLHMPARFGSHRAALAPLGMGLMARAADDGGAVVIPLSRTMGGAGAVYQRCSQGDHSATGSWCAGRGRSLANSVVRWDPCVSSFCWP